MNNTYHLGLRPGQKVLDEVGGAHRFQGWGGNILTGEWGGKVWCDGGVGVRWGGVWVERGGREARWVLGEGEEEGKEGKGMAGVGEVPGLGAVGGGDGNRMKDGKADVRAGTDSGG